MIWRATPPPELRALLAHERALPPVSALRRARAMARARAALAASVVTAAAPPVRASRGRWVAAVAAGVVVAAAMGAAAYEIHVLRFAPATTLRLAGAGEPPVAVFRAPASAVSKVADRESVPPAEVGSSPTSSARAELRLLRQARAAVARGDFAAALPPIAEHTRLFRNGRLAEEREALRVKALVGLGREREARHAAAAFRARFPRSVLLPAVSQMPGSRP